MKTELLFVGGDHARPLDIIRSPRARHMRLAVDPRDGSVRLTLPERAPIGSALKWAETKRYWVEAQLARLPQFIPIENGMMIAMGGDSLTLDWNAAHPRNPARVGDRLRVGGSFDEISLRLVRWLKREAKALFEIETHHYAVKAGVTVACVGIGDPVSRWGSCSASGDIRYSWRLILAPCHVRRATIAHEVAHRVHMNHGAAFHALVRSIFEGDPGLARVWLKNHGASLHWFGRSS